MPTLAAIETTRCSSAIGALAHLLDERGRDLEDVDGEALQVAERRVAGAEVVDRQPHAERLELVQLLERCVAALDDHALGDLEDQAHGVEAGVAQRGGNVVHERLVL